jgi:cellulose synthase/poly-beta-1,6-N-acetylglucosamine synthase-like glycosyltransferase
MWARDYSSKPTASSSMETPMTFSLWVRQIHRWLAILFTLTVLANFIAMALGPVPPLVTYSPLLPLFLLMFSGLYMFALPYVKGQRA